MKTLPPKAEIKNSWELASPGLDSYLEGLKKQIRSFMRKAGIHAHVKSRVKAFDSFYEKLLRLRRGQNPIDVTDLIAIRVVCPFLDDTHRMEAFFKENFKVIEADHKGRKRNFMEFGYESIHLLIEGPEPENLFGLPGTLSHCEVQIRTTLQDAWAEVEHQLIYKSPLSLPNDGIRRKLASLNASLTLSDLIFQELRDHQKELWIQEQRRRESLVQKIQGKEDSVESGQNQEMDETKDWLQKDVSIKEHLESLILQALNLHAQKNYAEAIEVYTHALGGELQDPIYAMLINHRGMAHFVLGNLTEAQADFAVACIKNPQNQRAFFNAGVCFRLQQNFSAAIRSLDEVLQLDEDNVDALYQKALCLYELNRYIDSLECCEALLILKPESRDALELEVKIRAKLIKD